MSNSTSLVFIHSALAFHHLPSYVVVERVCSGLSQLEIILLQHIVVVRVSDKGTLIVDDKIVGDLSQASLLPHFRIVIIHTDTAWMCARDEVKLQVSP